MRLTPFPPCFSFQYPQHDEVLPLSGPGASASAGAPGMYTLKGYAYSGGGRKVIRSEISLDQGKTWRLATLNHPETPNASGKYWCWCFWQLDVPVSDLVGCKEIALRSWDEGMNTQPKVSDEERKRRSPGAYRIAYFLPSVLSNAPNEYLRNAKAFG